MKISKFAEGGLDVIIFESNEFLDIKRGNERYFQGNKWEFVFIPMEHKNDFLLASEIRNFIEESLSLTGEIYYYA